MSTTTARDKYGSSEVCGPEAGDIKENHQQQKQKQQRGIGGKSPLPVDSSTRSEDAYFSSLVSDSSDSDADDFEGQEPSSRYADSQTSDGHNRNGNSSSTSTSSINRRSCSSSACFGMTATSGEMSPTDEEEREGAGMQSYESIFATLQNVHAIGAKRLEKLRDEAHKTKRAAKMLKREAESAIMRQKQDVRVVEKLKAIILEQRREIEALKCDKAAVEGQTIRPRDADSVLYATNARLQCENDGLRSEVAGLRAQLASRDPFPGSPKEKPDDVKAEIDPDAGQTPGLCATLEPAALAVAERASTTPTPRSACKKVAIVKVIQPTHVPREDATSVSTRSNGGSLTAPRARPIGGGANAIAHTDRHSSESTTTAAAGPAATLIAEATRSKRVHPLSRYAGDTKSSSRRSAADRADGRNVMKRKAFMRF